MQLLRKLPTSENSFLLENVGLRQFDGLITGPRLMVSNNYFSEIIADVFPLWQSVNKAFASVLAVTPGDDTFS